MKVMRGILTTQLSFCFLSGSSREAKRSFPLSLAIETRSSCGLWIKASKVSFKSFCGRDDSELVNPEFSRSWNGFLKLVKLLPLPVVDIETWNFII
jgi:hypothetical protein